MKDECARDRFWQNLEDAPYGAKGFFETIATHFDRRTDTSVRYTDTANSDMRLWAHWTKADGKEGEQVFATMTWQPRNEQVFARCKLTPSELALLGLSGATDPTASDEPQKSDISLDEGFWRYKVEEFIRMMEAARIKLESCFT